MSSQLMAQFYTGGIIALMMDHVFPIYLPLAKSGWIDTGHRDLKYRLWTTAFFVPDQAVRCYSEHYSDPPAYKLN